MLTGYLRRVVVTLACVVSATLTATAPAAEERQVQNLAQYAYGGCTMRDGPGDFAQNCFSVYYSGATVQRLWSYIQAVKFPVFPATVCEATFEVWGTLASGAPYRNSQVVHGCSAISSGSSLEGLNLIFQPGSKICSRSLWQNSWSNPACHKAPDKSSWSGRPWSPHQK